VTPSSCTSDGAEVEEESIRKCSWAPSGSSESRVGDVLMSASVDKVVEE
jgi:hypothetical protein